MGKGKDPSKEALEHQSTPLSALKDPSSFGPPPKRVPGQTPASPSTSRASTGDLGAPLSQSQVEADARDQQQRYQAANQEADEPTPPPGPFRADTTGLSTTNLPKPPAFRAGSRSESPTAAASTRPKPALPPRLPPRTGQTTGVIPASPPPAYNDTPANPSAGILNQGALNRLGRAGISVPGLGIGRTTSPPLPARNNSIPLPAPPPRTGSTTSSPISPAQTGPQLGELQSRFAKMKTGSSSAAGTDAAPGTGGTTWAQKQAALKTAGDFRKDPSSVSLSDARTAASTANNFRERHGEQVASGWKAANNLNQKYGVADKVKSYSSSETVAQASSPTSSGFGSAGKKAPPPPPAKRRELQADPPPIPLGSKPKP